MSKKSKEAKRLRKYRAKCRQKLRDCREGILPSFLTRFTDPWVIKSLTKPGIALEEMIGLGTKYNVGGTVTGRFKSGDGHPPFHELPKSPAVMSVKFDGKECLFDQEEFSAAPKCEHNGLSETKGSCDIGGLTKRWVRLTCLECGQVWDRDEE